MTPETGPTTFFDRVAIAFGAVVIGYATAFVVALPLLFVIGMLFHVDLAWLGGWLFLKAPALFGLVCGIVGFVSPTLLTDWLGNAWRAAVGIWRSFYGG